MDGGIGTPMGNRETRGECYCNVNSEYSVHIHFKIYAINSSIQSHVLTNQGTDCRLSASHNFHLL